ncbi:permease of the drug/metabolite transporter (dmt) superfamily [hydrocarbon metagenome]|uniref:Permease of the drug/metabolite transporter (Dmt) superfamily n=1 Tax=hydrocarbon metagenome TaxID=938273 RepID=A0A0W8FYI4_9ZZZZ
MTWFIIALISAVLSATASIFEKKILFRLGALEFSFLAAVLTLLFSIPFFFAVDYASLQLNSLLVLYLKSILGALAFWCVMLAIKNMELSGALPLLVLTPGIVAFFAFLFLGEALSNFEIIGMILLLAGTYILERRGKDFFEPFIIFIKSRNHHYIFFALSLFTITSLADKWLLRDFQLEPTAFIPFQHLFLAVNFLIIVLVKETNVFNNIKNHSTDIWLFVIAVSIFTVGYRWSQVEAVKIAPVALVLTVKRSSVFFATIIGGKIFNEHNLLRKAIATLIMIAGAVIMLY